MPHRHPETHAQPLPAAHFTQQMVGIGINFAAADPEAPIEETLVHASALGMDSDDLRVLAVLTTWLQVHHAHVNADRLVRVVSRHPSERVRIWPLSSTGSPMTAAI